MITSNGLTAINKYLVGAAGDWAGSIGIGLISTTSTAASTTSLQYEVARYPVNLKSYKPYSASSKVILKTSLPTELVASIYEIGVFPAASLNSAIPDYINITDFSETTSSSSSWTINSNPASFSASTRIGGHGIILPSASTASFSGLNFDTTNFNVSDYVNILYYTSSSISSGTLTVTFGDSNSPQNTWSASGSLPNTASNTWGVLQLSFAAKSASFAGISSASISMTSSGSIALDHMKLVKTYVKPVELKLTARSESASALVTKVYGQSVELEYYLQVN